MTDHTDLIARLRKGYEYGDSGVVLEAASALEAAQAEIANLHTVMMVAAVEISEHWDAHCDAEGYGPVNLLRHLKNNYPERYGYDSHTVVRMEKERDAAKAEIEAVRKANIDCVNHFDALRIDYEAAQAEIEAQQHRIQSLWMERDVVRVERDKALARIAKLEPKRNVSPPSEALVLHKMRYHFWDAEDDEPADFELFDAGVECDTCIDVALVRQDRLDELIAALARLAELTKQEPVGYLYDWVHRSSLGRGDATYTGFTKDKAHAEKHDNAIAIYAAAGASPVQPSQDLQSVADALTIEQLNDKVARLMAVQPSQAVEPTEAQLVAGVKAMRLFVTKNSIKDFRDGFIAAINAKESGK